MSTFHRFYPKYVGPRGPRVRVGACHAVAVVAACECGWTGEEVAGPFPGGAVEGAVGDANQLWEIQHMLPLTTPDPSEVLILSEDAGGPRYYLDGRPVHAGTIVELLLAGDFWVPVRFEWSWTRNGAAAEAYLALGGPAEAHGRGAVVSFEIPAGAVLRWPGG